VCQPADRALDGLLDKCLVVRADDAPEPRFGMLESIRDFAAERLAADGDARGLRARHAGYFRALAARMDAALRAGEPVAAAGDQRRAAAILAAVDATRHAMDIEPDSDDQALRQRVLKLLDQHGQDFVLGHAEGQALDLPAALSLATSADLIPP
jgi:hypothetical protein